MVKKITFIDKDLVSWVNIQKNFSESIKKLIRESIQDYGIQDYFKIEHVHYIKNENGIITIHHGKLDPDGPDVQKFE